MGQVLHGSATTTEAIREAMQHGQELEDPGQALWDQPEDRKRRVTATIKREMKRQAAVEPVIGHIKNEHRMDRNYLAHGKGDAINAVLAAVGYNFRLLLNRLKLLLRLMLLSSCSSAACNRLPREIALLTVD
jgi:hypothetical protein